MRKHPLGVDFFMVVPLQYKHHTQKKGTMYMIHSIFQFDNINFNGGNLSSDGGSLLMFSYISNHHFFNSLSGISFSDARRYFRHSNSGILTQLIERSLLGYFRQSDQDILRDDPLLGVHITPASQPSISRFYDRITEKTNRTFKSIIQKQACQFLNNHRDEIILDADSTLVTTTGRQEGAGYISHYKETGYHPLVINEFNTKLLVSAVLRSGNAYSSNGIIEELKEVFPYISGKDHRKISFRGDSAFYSDEIMSYLDGYCEFFIRAKGYKKLHSKVLEDVYKKKINLDNYNSRNPYYGEIRYTVGKSREERRVVYKVFSQTDKDGQLSLFPMIYCVMTNKEDGNAKSIMDFYEARGASENFTKEVKNDFDAGTLSHQSFLKNEMDFLISAYAYNLFHMFQNEILEGKDKTITMETYRRKYQKIAVKVVRHSRKISLSFSSAYRFKEKFRDYLSKIQLE